MTATITTDRSELEAALDAAIKASHWDLAEKLEEILWPEHFADHPDADPFCEDCGEVYPAGTAHDCEPDFEDCYQGCECEMDWDCGCGTQRRWASARDL